MSAAQQYHELINKELFSSFSDKRKFAGRVPTGRYLATVNMREHGSIWCHLSKEVKKRGAIRLSLDASYKEAKKLARCNGRPVFKGYITALNEVGEMRLALHVNSESHDQMRAAFEAFKYSTSEYGLPPLELYFSDNAKGDMCFIKEIFPSL